MSDNTFDLDANPTTYESEGQGSAALRNAVEDDLGNQASHDRAQGTGPGKVGGHAKDPEAHLETRESDPVNPDSQEGLEAGTIASHTGSNKFMASLEEAAQKQEESGSTSI